MSNTNIDLVGLDFQSLKTNLKTFLKNNTQFKDIDYEGSNINVLMDLLAYNTYLNAFYTNMVASEMFLDTAQLKDSIMSHAKELGYTPRSFVSSKATITVAITPSTSVTSVAIPKYTSFTTRVGSNTYTFSTSDSIVLTSSNNGVFSTTVDVFEGIQTTESYVLNYANTAQRFILSNDTVDTSSIDVTVYEDNGATPVSHTISSSLLNVTSSSRVFFVQPAENQQYEILFGDNVYGKRPKDGSTVVVKYRACSGELPNGGTVFVADSSIDGHSNVSVTTGSAAAGGAVSETIESVRFNAPRAFQAQDRAVTTTDYETLLSSAFADIQAISVYGGEDHDPPQYGKVYISVDVANADGAPESRKKAYLDYIKTKTPVTITAEFEDPAYTYVKVITEVEYDVNKTSKTTNDIATLVKSAISSYSTNSLEDFKKTLFYSNFTKNIDAADSSIIGNDTEIFLVKRIIPILNSSSYQFVINTENALATETGKKVSVSETHYGHTLTSSVFTYNNNSCIVVDDTLGNVYIAALQSNTIEILQQIGTINYSTGKVIISQFNISAFDGNYIEFVFRTASKNISAMKNVILEIAPENVSVNVVGIKL